MLLAGPLWRSAAVIAAAAATADPSSTCATPSIQSSLLLRLRLKERRQPRDLVVLVVQRGLGISRQVVEVLRGVLLFLTWQHRLLAHHSRTCYTRTRAELGGLGNNNKTNRTLGINEQRPKGEST
jgi:hypothetical protein